MEQYADFGSIVESCSLADLITEFIVSTGPKLNSRPSSSGTLENDCNI